MRTNLKFILLWSSALALIGALPHQAYAAAMGKVLNIVGRVDIVRGNRTRTLQVRDEFQAGDVLRVLPKSAATLVYYAGGARYALAAQSACRATPNGPMTVTGAAPHTLSPLDVELVKAAGQTNAHYAGTVIRSTEEPGAPRRLQPLGGVRDPAVVLHWESPAAGTAASELRWEVQVRSGERAKTLWVRTLEAGATECVVPAGLLQAGRRYEWTVRAVGGEHNGASGQAFLALLTPDEQAQLQRLERRAARHRTGPNDLDASRLLAEVYEGRALYGDALRVWTEVALALPKDRDAAHRIAHLRAKLQQ